MLDVIRKPQCQLVGTDGNAFAIMGAVSKALKKDGQRERADLWMTNAQLCTSYDDLLVLLHDYVEVL